MRTPWMHQLALGVSLALGMLACSELSTPADLDREQILAVRATPRTLVPGESVVLDALLAGPGGRFRSETTWQLASDVTGVEMETLESGELLIRADESLSTGEGFDIELQVALADGDALRARKHVEVAPTATANPVIRSVRVDGVAVENDGALTLQGKVVALAVDAEPTTTVAWYTSLGEIRYYRDANTSLEIAGEESGEGLLAVVVRDREGGVTWHICLIQSQ